MIERVNKKRWFELFGTCNWCTERTTSRSLLCCISNTLPPFVMNKNPAVRYCSITELTPVLDEDGVELRSVHTGRRTATQRNAPHPVSTLSAYYGLPYVIGQTIIFFPCDFYLSFFFLSFFLSSPNLSGRRLDVYHTSTHGVALVRI